MCGRHNQLIELQKLIDYLGKFKIYEKLIGIENIPNNVLLFTEYFISKETGKIIQGAEHYQEQDEEHGAQVSRYNRMYSYKCFEIQDKFKNKITIKPIIWDEYSREINYELRITYNFFGSISITFLPLH